MAVGRVEALCNRIEKELQGHVSSDSLHRCIFKVPNHLRKVNEMAYEPQVISIGPYHRGKDHLKAMEVHKKHYLKMLLDRNKEKTLKEYVEALEGLKEEALKFYSEPPYQRDGEDQFVEMMLFDGCFVVELIRKSAMEELREEKDYLLTHFLLRTVLRDLLLIENQLPFFILLKLFDMTKMPDEANQDFMQMAINCFSIMMPGPCNKKIENYPGINHLLGLLHDSCVSADDRGSSNEDEIISLLEDDGSPEEEEGSLEEKSESAGIFESSDLSPDDTPFEGHSSSELLEVKCCVARFVGFPPAIMEGHEEINCKGLTIGSASELHEAGINFKEIEGGFFNINFEKGVMSIPILKIVDDTECILRNLVAYEQCYRDITSRRFTEYIRVMDCLINTEKDVELLCRSEVIKNMLGDNEVVADIFNKICDNVLIVEANFFYADLFVEVNEHCKIKWNQWKANLRHNYFNTPWASISVIAAVILLLLTVLQSVYSVLAYHHQH